MTEKKRVNWVVIRPCGCLCYAASVGQGPEDQDLRHEVARFIRLGKEGKPMTAHEWNELYRVGTRVIVWRDNGEALCTTTRSEAWELADGTPVISVEGIGACYSLDRVRRALKVDKPAESLLC